MGGGWGRAEDGEIVENGWRMGEIARKGEIAEDGGDSGGWGRAEDGGDSGGWGR